MEKLHDILHIAGAVCLIVFCVTGLVLAVRWWHKIDVMCERINFLFSKENERQQNVKDARFVWPEKGILGEFIDVVEGVDRRRFKTTIKEHKIATEFDTICKGDCYNLNLPETEAKTDA